MPAEPDTTVRVGVLCDVNKDGLVNCGDLAIVRSAFGKKSGSVGFDIRADINGDGVVDVRDLSGVSRYMSSGSTCR